jgi:uncharacterized Fe-S center protein
MGDENNLISLDEMLCGQCGGCVPVCPVNAIFLSPQALEIDDGICNCCENCVEVCPVGALRATWSE